MFKRDASNATIAQARKQVQENSQDAKAWASLGDAYFYANHSKEAIPCYLQSLKLDVTRDDVAFRLSGSLIVEEHYDDAIALLEDLAERLPVPTHWWALTQAYFLAKKPKETVYAARKAIELKPDDAELWIWLGKAHVDLGNTAQAIEAYKEAAKLVPQNADLWAELAACYLEIRQPREALTALERAAKLDSKYRKELDDMKRDWQRTVIAPFEEGSTPSADLWLRFFVKFILENHDIEPAVNALMAGLPFFNERFARELEQVEHQVVGMKWEGVDSFMVDNIYVATAANVLYVYRNYIAKGKSRQEIKKTFEESAHNILDGHEPALHR